MVATTEQPKPQSAPVPPPQIWEIRLPLARLTYWTDQRPTIQGGLLAVKALRQQADLQGEPYAKLLTDEAILSGQVMVFKKTVVPAWFTVTEADAAKARQARQPNAEESEPTDPLAAKIAGLENAALGLDDE